jgi:hypothetical protein
MTAAEFKAIYPEFATAADALVNAKIAEADLQTSDSFGTRRDSVLALLTSHLLAISPYGVNAKMVNKDGGTVYGERLKTVQVIHGVARERIR